MPSTELLLFADSESNADMLYFSGVFVPDPFIAFTHRSRRIAIVSDLELARVRRASHFDEVLPLAEWTARARIAFPSALPFPDAVIALAAREFKIPTFRVAADFPFGPATGLQQLGLEIHLADGQLFPGREYKSDAEAAQIRAGNDAAAAGFRAFEKLLRTAEIRKGHLYHGKRRLTSDIARQAILAACFSKGAIAAHTIVACGNEACDPHARGSGPILANSLIIVDIFPRVLATGYHGDMTRTYLKGTPSEAQRKLYETVFSAQQAAIAAHRARRSGNAIYQDVCKRFVEAGYSTGRSNGVPNGFFHGLGHGLGLAVHEPPRINALDSTLRAGQVVTVEPGLYYPGLGGVRVEDVIRITKGEPELLSHHPYRWVIR